MKPTQEASQASRRNMDSRASISILLLLLGLCQAALIQQEWFEGMVKDRPRHVDMTTQILNINNGSSELLIEGDVVLPRTRNALVCPANNCFWLKNPYSNIVQVPYVISSDFSYDDKLVITNAMVSFHTKTCIQFVPRTSESDYISIQSLDGCYSSIGKQGGSQVVSLSTSGCVYHGIVQHELNHALGFYHEHTRSDRDQYVRINWQNISPDMTYNFQTENTNNQNTPYDYGSVMHYGRTAFALQPGQETITPIPDDTVQIGQRQELSSIDVLRINKLYNC